MSKAADNIEEFLKWEDINFQRDQQDENTEIFYFGAKGDNILKFLFMVESRAEVVQFRLWSVLEDEEKEILKNNTDKVNELMKYLLYKNYEYKLGKWAMDPNDFELNFVIAHQESPENGLEKGLLKRIKTLLFNDGDEMLTEIKQIINGAQSSSSESGDVALEDLLKSLKGSSGI